MNHRTTSERASDRSRGCVAFAALLAACAGTALASGSTADLNVQSFSNTGLASFVTAADGGSIAVPLPAGRAEVEPMDFLLEYGHLFGVNDPVGQLEVTRTETDWIGHTHTTYQQIHRGVRVFSGVLKVHQNPAGDIIAANGDFYPVSSKLHTTPILTPADAESIAAAALEKGWPEVEQSELVLVDPGWYGDPPIGAHLAYYVILRDMSAAIREAFFVDAHTGAILDRWSLIHTVRNREIYDGEGTSTLPGTLARAEGDLPLYGDHPDINAAYDYLGDVYDYYFRAFGRDGINGQGMPMRATVNSTAPGCPNAYWDGTRMVFCDGLVTDDIAAHELTHGVTEFSAGLIYQNQSGQLNESFSDIFGELVDLFNGDAALVNTTGVEPLWPAHMTGPGTDTPNDRRTACSYYSNYSDGVRWLMGEDAVLFGGASRDMWDPTCFGLPDRTHSPLQLCQASDYGGVHYGMGIPCHAFAMVTDGKSFNGYTVNGIGPIKAGAVWYRALTVYLTEASEFVEAYHALNQSAAELVGTYPNDPRTGDPSGSMFTTADALQVDKALRAVEMDTVGPCAAFTMLDTADAPLCPLRQTIEAYDFEDVTNDWQVQITQGDPVTPYQWVRTGSLPQGRPGFALYCEDLNSPCTGDDESAVHSLYSPEITLPSTLLDPMLKFTHYMDSETSWDGGNLRVRVNGGDWGLVGPDAIVHNGYNLPLYPGSGESGENPMAGQWAWSGSGGWGTTLIVLSGIVSDGDTIQFRFDFGKDVCAGEDGWYIDDVEIFMCDCNTNGISDQTDIAMGTSQDRQPNGFPDECEVPPICPDCPDCNTDGIPDDCQLDAALCTNPDATITVSIHTDWYPDETSWILVERGRDVEVATGGPYASSDTDYTHEVPVCSISCYDFTIYDSYDGWIYAPGSYQILYQGVEVVSRLGHYYFGPEETVSGIGPGCGSLGNDCNEDGVPDECEVPPICADCPDCQPNSIPDDCELTGNDCNNNGVPDGCETDTDGDGVIDDCEECDDDPDKTSPGECGCGVPETPDCGSGGGGGGGQEPPEDDECPDDPDKTSPGVCGCNVPDTDTDRDGTPNCIDSCPFDASKTEPGECGCGEVEDDSDGDGTPDCRDACPDDAAKTTRGECGCGSPETDTDGDGVPDCIDGTPDGTAQALTVTGPGDVVPGAQAQYAAEVVFADGASEDVSDSDRITWEVLDTVIRPQQARLSVGDTISENGTLTVSPDRDFETTLSVIATFDDGAADLQGATLVRVVVEKDGDERPATPTANGDETPAEQPTSEEPDDQTSGTVQRTGLPCGLGMTMPLASSLLLLGFVRVSRIRRSTRARLG